MIRRNTPSKEAVLQVLQKSIGALSQDMIEDQLKGKIDRATIYRILNRFCEDGITHKIVGDDGKKYFALCHECDHTTEHSHHDHIHFKCISCGQLECLKEHIHVKLPSGYLLRETQFLITGVCKKCNNS